MLSDFEEIEKLGVGAYSTVSKVLRKSDGKIYALKKVKLSDQSEKDRENSLNEVRLLASFSHPGIVGFREAFLDEKSRNLCIIE